MDFRTKPRRRSSPGLKAGAPAPTDLWWDAQALGLAVKLWILADDRGVVDESTQSIAEQIGISRYALMRGLTALEQSGIIQRIGGKQGKAYTYQFVSPDVQRIDDDSESGKVQHKDNLHGFRETRTSTKGDRRQKGVVLCKTCDSKTI